MVDLLILIGMTIIIMIFLIIQYGIIVPSTEILNLKYRVIIFIIDFMCTMLFGNLIAFLIVKFMHS